MGGVPDQSRGYEPPPGQLSMSTLPSPPCATDPGAGVPCSILSSNFSNHLITRSTRLPGPPERIPRRRATDHSGAHSDASGTSDVADDHLAVQPIPLATVVLHRAFSRPQFPLGNVESTPLHVATTLACGLVSYYRTLLLRPNNRLAKRLDESQRMNLIRKHGMLFCHCQQQWTARRARNDNACWVHGTVVGDSAPLEFSPVLWVRLLIRDSRDLSENDAGAPARIKSLLVT